jgi:hypothetical protein
LPVSPKNIVSFYIKIWLMCVSLVRSTK